MKVNYVTFADDRFAAFRYRIKMPGDYIGNYTVTQFPDKADIHVYSKPYHNNPHILAAMYQKASTTPYIFDLCDDVFGRERHVRNYVINMIHGAVAVTTSTDTMRDVIKHHTSVDSVVISDPYEFPEAPIKEMDDRVMWFGSRNNILTLQGCNINNIEIVCEDDKLVRKVLDTFECDYKFTEWSLKNLQAAFDRNTIVFIPSTDEIKKRVKSPNRVVESIRQGMSVIAYPLPAYQQFGEWISFNGEPKQLIPEAQEYVRKNFDITVIGEQWKQLFQAVLSGLIWDADVGFSMDG